MRRVLAPSFVFVLLSFLLSASDAVWLDIPFVKQPTEGCGAASIAMVMQYWARQSGRAPDADADTIQRAIYSRDAHGVYASAMEKYFQQNGRLRRMNPSAILRWGHRLDCPSPERQSSDRGSQVESRAGEIRGHSESRASRVWDCRKP